MANTTDFASSSLVVADSPGNGKGIFAAKDIAKGECLVREKHILHGYVQYTQLHDHLKLQIQNLPTHQQSAVMLLHWPHRPQQPLVSRFWANAFDLPNSVLPQGGVFLYASKFNNACVPNAFWIWNDRLEQLTVYATADIPKDKEIFISYASPDTSYGERVDVFNKIYGFKCACSICSSPDALQKWETLRLKAAHLHTEMVALGYGEEPDEQGREWKAWVLATPGSDEDPLPTILKAIDVQEEAGFLSLYIAALYGEASACCRLRGNVNDARLYKKIQRETVTWCVGEEDARRIVKDNEY